MIRPAGRRPGLIAAVLIAGALGGATGGSLVDGKTPRAGAQADFSVTPEQLRINQRISQAAVRRVNAVRPELDALEGRIGAEGLFALPRARCDVQTYSGGGRGVVGIGTIVRSCGSRIDWAHAGDGKFGFFDAVAVSYYLGAEVFPLGPRALVESGAPSGSTTLPPGTYERPTVASQGDWTITIRPR